MYLTLKTPFTLTAATLGAFTDRWDLAPRLCSAVRPNVAVLCQRVQNLCQSMFNPLVSFYFNGRLRNQEFTLGQSCTQACLPANVILLHEPLPLFHITLATYTGLVSYSIAEFFSEMDAKPYNIELIKFIGTSELRALML